MINPGPSKPATFVSWVLLAGLSAIGVAAILVPYYRLIRDNTDINVSGGLAAYSHSCAFDEAGAVSRSAERAVVLALRLKTPSVAGGARFFQLDLPEGASLSERGWGADFNNDGDAADQIMPFSAIRQQQILSASTLGSAAGVSMDQGVWFPSDAPEFRNLRSGNAVFPPKSLWASAGDTEKAFDTDGGPREWDLAEMEGGHIVVDRTQLCWGFVPR